ncbi:MAG: FAD-dependent oxidoreductase [Eubacteriales bacterium]
MLKGRVLVVGGGIAGLTTAERLGKAGVEVVLVEKEPFLGGRVARLHRYYPRLCPPRCGLEILIKSAGSLPNLSIYVNTEVVEAQKRVSGTHTVTLRKKPGLVKESCTGCGLCEKVCPVVINEPALSGYVLKAIGGNGPWGYPAGYHINEKYCLGESCNKCGQSCPEGAIDLKQGVEIFSVGVQGIILATGGELYDPSRIIEYGYGRLPGVITAMELERLFRPDGPTGGVPVHPVTGKRLQRVAFIQCAGSRDKKHLPYCSGYCCTVTMKQIEYLHQSCSDIGTWVFYRDIRTPGSKEEYYRHVREEYRPVFIRGLPSSVEYQGEKLIIRAEDTLTGKKVAGDFDLVVLATGMTPPVLPVFNGVERDSNGFFSGHNPCDPTELRRSGIWAAGCAQQPMDAGDSVRSALAAVAQCLVKILQQPAQYPEVNKKKCDHCGRCVKECPYGAIILGPDGYPEVSPSDCRSCGICQGGCPLICINLPGQGIGKVEKVIDRVLSGDNAGPTILLFLCSNDAYPAWKQLAGLEGVFPLETPCIGSVNMAWINEALIGGLDGVMLAGCRPDQCHHGAGIPLAETRLQNLRETLGRMRIEPERLYLTGVNIDDSSRLLKEIYKFSKRLKKMGPSPFR